MMNDPQMMQEKSVLRWGGLAGILGGARFILVFVIVGVFAGVDPAGPEGQVMRFPDIRAARSVENGPYLVVLILWVIHLLALYRAPRRTSLAPALFGSVLGILGLDLLSRPGMEGLQPVEGPVCEPTTRTQAKGNE